MQIGTLIASTCVLSIGLLAAPSLAANDSTPSLPKKVTYAEHVAPVISENCTSCHRPDDIAPMALRTYEEVRPWAKSIRRAVNEGTMPPWHADPAHGSFSNDRSLSEYEKALINKWVKQGAALGDATRLDSSSVVAGGWRLGEPDLVVTFEAVSLEAGGPDVFEDLKMAYELPEDRWVKAIEVAPGDRTVLHHVIIFVLEEGQGSPTGWLGAWAAGMEPMQFPEGTGRLLRKGSTLVADMHYHPSDVAAVDQTRIGLHFYDGEPEKEMVNLWVQNSSFKIPAGADNYEVRSSFTFKQDSTVHALLPHMHYRGKDFTYTARYPDGREEILLKVSAYDFNWQTLYKLAEPLDMPKGSKIDCVAHFDNSTKNAANPDPTKDITFGSESFDEMMIGFVDYTVKEGLRPMTAEEQVAETLIDLAASYPGETFDVTAKQGDFTMPTALYLPAEGPGRWYIPMNGQVYEARLNSIEHHEDGTYTARLVAPFGSFDVEGIGGFGEKTVSGSINLGDDGELTFEGTVVE